MTDKQEPEKQPKPIRTYPKPLPVGYKMSPVQRVLRKYRVKRRFSRNRLATTAGVWPRTIEMYETTNTHTPSLAHLAAIFNALELDIWVIDRRDGTLIERIY